MRRTAMRTTAPLLLLLLLLLAPPLAAQDAAAPSRDPVALARADLAAKRFQAAMNRLEPLVIGGALSESGRDLLARVYREACNDAYARKEYRAAIALAQKLLALRPDDAQMAAILHKLYLRGGFYTEGIQFGKGLLEGDRARAAAPADLAKIHGGQAMLYAQIGEPGRAVASLCDAWRLSPGGDGIAVYLRHITPDPIPRDRFLQALREERNGPVDARGALALLLEKPSSAAADRAAVAPEEPGVPVAVVLRSTRSVSLIDATAEAEFAPKREIYLDFLEEGDRAMAEKRFADALAAYDRARATAPPQEFDTVSRRRMQAYFAKNRDKIEYGGYAVIAFLLLAFLYHLGLFRARGQYGVIAPGKLLAKAQRFIDKENWDAAISEYSKIPEPSLARDESIRVSVNLALAYMAKEQHANAIVHARRALAKDPHNVDASLILGKVYLKTGDRTSRSAEIYEFLAERNLANVRMMKELCAAFLKGNIVTEKSAKIAGDVLRFEQDDTVAGQLLAKWYHACHRTDDEAADFIRRMAERMPKDTGLRIFLLEIFFRRKDYKAVVREAMYLFALTVDNVIVHSLFIDALVRLQQPKVLLQEYQRLLAENPGSVVVKFIHQSLQSLLVRKRAYPEVDVALSLKVNFTVCPKCFHLNLAEFHHCQKCRSQLTP